MPPMTADLRHIDVWLFDLDNTLYPPESLFMAQIEARMTEFVAKHVGLSHDDAHALQKKYYRELGTTLAGLMAHHDVRPEDYLDHVHDVPLDPLIPDPELAAAIHRLPGRRLVFTNGDERPRGGCWSTWAWPTLSRMSSTSLGRLRAQAGSGGFDKLVAAHAVAPAVTAFFEDARRTWSRPPPSA